MQLIAHPPAATPAAPLAVASWPVWPVEALGYGEIVRRAYAGSDLSELTRRLVARLCGPLADPAALLDLATVLQLQGGDLAQEGRVMQQNALRLQRSFAIRHGAGTGPRLLAFVTDGDFMANVPLDFLLRGSDAVLILYFVDAETADLADLPGHDVAFLAIAEAPENALVLARLGWLLAGWRGPIFNNAAALIAALTRDCVSRFLAEVPGIYAPPTLRLSRQDLLATVLGEDLAVMEFPIVLRPIGSHAGAGLVRIEDRAALAVWLRQSQEAEVYAAPFVDYRDAEGYYSKARVVLIEGQAFASHLARSRQWRVHYLNADMQAHPERRAAEAKWMAGFDTGFARRHAQAFAALYEIFDLEYFGIDCAEMPDGRLLIFEVDVAMIVHDMDDEGLFPYKKPAMQKLFAGFLEAIAGAAP
ncbi:MAG: hypothetical protein ABIQ85_03535 [Cypionkella sp.]